MMNVNYSFNYLGEIKLMQSIFLFDYILIPTIRTLIKQQRAIATSELDIVTKRPTFPLIPKLVRKG